MFDRVMAGCASCVAALTVAAAAAAAAGPTNAVPNGGFEAVDAVDSTRPLGWSKPDGLGVRWEAAGVGGAGRCIVLDTRVSERAMVEQWRKTGLSTEWDIPNPGGNPVAETYGLSYYSGDIPVVSGVVYRLRFDYQGGAGAKVWVRGWGMHRGERRRRYEFVANAPVSPDGWTSAEHEFNPTSRRPEVDTLRVMLYAYYPPGEFRFDNVRLETIGSRP